MTAVVVDTDVASFLFKGDSRAQGYLVHLQARQWLVSLDDRSRARTMGSVGALAGGSKPLTRGSRQQRSSGSYRW